MAWIEGNRGLEGGEEIVCEEDDWLVTSLLGCEEAGEGAWRTTPSNREDLSGTEPDRGPVDGAGGTCTADAAGAAWLPASDANAPDTDDPRRFDVLRQPPSPRGRQDVQGRPAREQMHLVHLVLTPLQRQHRGFPFLAHSIIMMIIIRITSIISVIIIIAIIIIIINVIIINIIQQTLLAHGNVIVLESVASGKTVRVMDDGRVEGSGGMGALGEL